MLRLANLFPPRFLTLLAAIIAITFVTVAYAADGATPPTTIDLGWFANFFATYIAPPLGLIVSFLLAQLFTLAKRKWNVDIDASMRDAAQVAITNAAGLLIAKGVHMTDGKTLDVGSPFIAQAVKYAQDAAPQALKHFSLGPDDVAAKIVAKVGVLTAPAAPAIVLTPNA